MSQTPTNLTPSPNSQQPALPELPSDPPGMSGGGKLGLLLTLLLLALAWAHTFSEMWLRWFPYWDRYTATLHDRLTKGDSYYTHGPMVPLVSLIIALLIYRKVGAPVGTRIPAGKGLGWLLMLPAALGLLAAVVMGRRYGLPLATPVVALSLVVGTLGLYLSRFKENAPAAPVGWILLGTSLVLHLLSVYARVTFVSGFALLGVWVALLVLWGGWPLLRAYWLPVAFLIFMVPLPMETIDGLNFQLKSIAGNIAVGLTNHVFGVPAILDGSYVHLMNAPDGSPKTLVVEDVCSGLRSLISLISFAALFAVICRAKGYWRWVMLAMAAPVAIACNVIRITALNLVAHYVDVDAAGPEGWFHNFSGVMVFAVALALLFGLEMMILGLGKQLKRNWSDPRLLGFLDSLPRGDRIPAATRKPAVLLVLALAAGLSLMWSAKTVAASHSAQARQALPATLHLGASGGEWASEELELDDLTLSILETRDYVYRRYAEPATPRSVDMMIVFSPDNRKGTHPPEVCLKGGGEQVVAKEIQWVTLPGAHAGKIAFRGLTTQRTDRLTYYLYIYKCGDAYTPSFPVQQARIFFNSLLLLHRNTAGALIRISVPVAGRDVEAARQLALATAADLMPAIDKGLP